MSRDLQAENLTISVPSLDPRCDKNCPYCVSKLTGLMKSDEDLMFRNVEKVKAVAKAAGVTSVLFTGKGEPTLNMEFLCYVSGYFRDFPLEIQTNGIKLCKTIGQHTEIVGDLDKLGFNVIAISMDNQEQFVQYLPLLHRINQLGMIVRLTVNLTNRFHSNILSYLLSYCMDYNVRQLMLRRIVAPQVHINSKAASWIAKNGWSDDKYNAMLRELHEMLRERGRKIRTMNEGTELWDLDGISIARSDYCIQEKAEAGGIRSLIFQEDGHLYTSWNSRASILF